MRRSTVWAFAGAALVGALGGLLIARARQARHKGDLLSPKPLARLAALGYLTTHGGTESIPLLRDYLAWEKVPWLRSRARRLLHELNQENP